MNLDPTDPTPLYHQLVLQYRQQILTGAMAIGTRLPGEEEMARIAGVSRITAKRALNELAGAGLVERTRGRGTIVTYAAPQGGMQADFDDLMQNLALIGASTEVDLLSRRELPGPPEIADALDLAKSTPVHEIIRRRRQDGRPFSHVAAYLPADLAQHITDDTLRHASFLSIFANLGVQVTSARQTLRAVLAGKNLAEALDILPGAALLQITRILRDDARRPIQHLTVHYRADLYALTMDLNRDDRNGPFRVENRVNSDSMSQTGTSVK
ncbi:MAG: GntR family transcriptional regulator [Pseudomonadota bacterium]